jgi:Protein of unknown function (DUF3107).
MDIRIGVTHSSRDIALEVEGDDKSQAAVRKTVEEALAGKVEVLWLKDKRGREVAIPAEKLHSSSSVHQTVSVGWGLASDASRVTFSSTRLYYRQRWRRQVRCRSSASKSGWRARQASACLRNG